MKTSKKGIDLIKKYEGCRLEAYRCPSGVLTIGYGHTSNVKPGMIINEQTANDLLISDLVRYENYVMQYDSIYHFNQGQFDALVSFTFNCGKSNLRSLVNGGLRSIQEISNSIPKYNKGGGKILKGLVKRRAEEKDLFDENYENCSCQYR